MIINNDRWCISEQAGRDIRNWLKFYQNTSHYMVASHESSSIKVLGVSDGPKINIAISTNL